MTDCVVGEFYSTFCHDRTKAFEEDPNASGTLVSNFPLKLRHHLGEMCIFVI
jgi:hypothetical protein